MCLESIYVGFMKIDREGAFELATEAEQRPKMVLIL